MEGHEITEWRPRNPIDHAARWIGLGVSKGFHYVLYLVLGAVMLGWLRPWWPYINTPTGWVFTAASILPVFVLIGVIWIMDKHQREPVLQLVDAFLFGSVVAVLAALLNGQFMALPPILFFLLIVGPGEEVVKLAGAYVSSFRQSSFDEHTDGLWYGMAAGAGFAAIENVTYVVTIEGASQAWQAVLIRLLITTPAHMVWTGYAGYFLGLAKFFPEHRATLIAKGLLVAILAHGVFDVLVTQLGLAGAIAGITMNMGLLAWLIRSAWRQTKAAQSGFVASARLQARLG